MGNRRWLGLGRKILRHGELGEAWMGVTSRDFLESRSKDTDLKNILPKPLQQRNHEYKK